MFKFILAVTTFTVMLSSYNIMKLNDKVSSNRILIEKQTEVIRQLTGIVIQQQTKETR